MSAVLWKSTESVQQKAAAQSTFREREPDTPQKLFVLCFCADHREGCVATCPTKGTEERPDHPSCRVSRAPGISCGSALEELVVKKENSQTANTATQ